VQTQLALLVLLERILQFSRLMLTETWYVQAMTLQYLAMELLEHITILTVSRQADMLMSVPLQIQSYVFFREALALALGTNVIIGALSCRLRALMEEILGIAIRGMVQNL
jgi:hypothetical protein